MTLPLYDDIVIGTKIGEFIILNLTEQKHGKIQYNCVCSVCNTLRTIPGYDLIKRVPNCTVCKLFSGEIKKREAKAAYYQRNKTKIRERENKRKLEFPISTESAREYGYRYNYGITISEYNEMYALQNGKCVICSVFKSIDGKRYDRLYVDHNHENLKIRGLLCLSCNMGLGKFKENIEFLKNAVKYMEEIKCGN